MKRVAWMTLAFAWTLILHQKDGSTIEIPGFIRETQCEAEGWYRGHVKRPNPNWYIFECIEK
jgi:hypothetical protein